GAFALWPGAPQGNDQAYVDGDSSQIIEIDWANSVSPSLLKCRKTSAGSIGLIVGMRLIISTRRPVLYSAPDGTGSLTSHVQTESGTGRLRGYVSELRFDYTITIAVGDETRVFVDAIGSYVMRG